MGTLLYTGKLIITSCWCGIQLAIPSSLFDEAKRIEKEIFCPLGHKFIYTETMEKENERLRQQVEVERDNAKFWREQERKAERRAIAQRGVTTKLKKRIANGICPCCKRTFANVARHMESQHPAWIEDEKKAKSEIARTQTGRDTQ